MNLKPGKPAKICQYSHGVFQIFAAAVGPADCCASDGCCIYQHKQQLVLEVAACSLVGLQNLVSHIVVRCLVIVLIPTLILQCAYI